MLPNIKYARHHLLAWKPYISTPCTCTMYIAEVLVTRFQSFTLYAFSLRIEYCVVCSGMLFYLHHRNSKLFFILQSLTTSKMRKFQTLKLSQFHKAKTFWTENWWSSGIMSNFLGEFFYVLGGKNFFYNLKKYIVASALKSCIKWS